MNSTSAPLPWHLRIGGLGEVSGSGPRPVTWKSSSLGLAASPERTPYYAAVNWDPWAACSSPVLLPRGGSAGSRFLTQPLHFFLPEMVVSLLSLTSPSPEGQLFDASGFQCLEGRSGTLRLGLASGSRFRADPLPESPLATVGRTR